MIEDFIVKYMWSACGYCLISIPVFFGPKAPRQVAAVGAVTEKAVSDSVTAAVLDESTSVAQRTEGERKEWMCMSICETDCLCFKRLLGTDYISNRRLLLSLADAGGRLMYSWKDLSELAGYTSRVYTLLSTLHDLDAGKFRPQPRVEGTADAAPPAYDLGDIRGQLIRRELGPYDDDLAGVEFNKAPIVAPAPGAARGGELLVKPLTFQVHKGEHILVTGPNGSGKTAVARVLAGLWPVFEGQVTSPGDAEGQVFFLPQRPYLSAGSLRDQ